jgi:hypothetical protein
VIAGALALALLAQAAQTAPVLSFPETGVDDTSAYRGYQTRFYRDARRNAVQVYLHPEGSRAVLVWANAANESAGFTVRVRDGRPVRMTWASDSAAVTDSGGVRSIEYGLEVQAPEVEVGLFVLGSMRIERDFVYARRHLAPFHAPPFRVAEESLLVAAVSRLPPPVRREHLSLLRAATLAELRSRLLPTITTSRSADGWLVRVERPSLDRRSHLRLELRTGPGGAVTRPTPRSVAIRAPGDGPVTLRVRVATDAGALTPLDRNEIFNAEFHRFLAEAARARDGAGRLRYRRLERQVRGVELLSSREKLMAGLPNFATYFGRDMMMTALMMRAVWRPAMYEHVIASVLRKLGPGGAVSHEEALGGQAIREHAVVYDSLLGEAERARRAGRRAEADSLHRRAGGVLSDLQRTRENYHMIDDEYQLPVLVARWLTDSTLTRARKRDFLLAADGGRGGETRLAGLLRELALIAGQTQAYADDPRAGNLVSFPLRDSVHRRSASWRDSDAGYGGGRFAMDVNAIWVPEALDAAATILAGLPSLELGRAALDSLAPGLARTPLARWTGDTLALRRAVETWRGARRHFEVTLGPGEIRERLEARLAELPEEERGYWRGVLGKSGEPRETLRFLALSLDEEGTPIPVVNTDPATGLFLGSLWAASDLEAFARSYPVALFVEGLGPLVANDAYAPAAVRERFRKDTYHGPRVVWGREVNLLLLGLANRVADGRDCSGRLRGTLQRTLEAVHASGLEHNELWSYTIEAGRLRPTRYGTTSDIQLWNGTNLAVQFALSRLTGAPPGSACPH